jgi:AcrR family transcriptional regulator
MLRDCYDRRMAVVGDAETTGLRERKKRRTRQLIADEALALFAAQGFQDTTLRQIADAAEVSPRTVSAYFPAKEALVFAEHDEVFDQLEERLADRPEGQLAADTLRAFLVDMLDDHGPDAEHSRRVRELVESDPALRIYERGLQERAERIVAAAVAADLGLPEDDLVPHMVGAATIATLDAMGRRMKEADPAEFEDQALRLIDEAMAFIGAGVQALARTPRAR